MWRVTINHGGLARTIPLRHVTEAAHRAGTMTAPRPQNHRRLRRNIQQTAAQARRANRRGATDGASAVRPCAVVATSREGHRSLGSGRATFLRGRKRGSIFL
jgi:hypothetical protein